MSRYERISGRADSNAAFAAGTLSDVVLAIAAMQQIEQAKIMPDQDVSGLLDGAALGITADQVLTHQGAGPELLAQTRRKSRPANSWSRISRGKFSLRS